MFRNAMAAMLIVTAASLGSAKVEVVYLSEPAEEISIFKAGKGFAVEVKLAKNAAVTRVEEDAAEKLAQVLANTSGSPGYGLDKDGLKVTVLPLKAATPTEKEGVYKVVELDLSTPAMTKAVADTTKRDTKKVTWLVTFDRKPTEADLKQAATLVRYESELSRGWTKSTTRVSVSDKDNAASIEVLPAAK
jgi:hypothetical protein